MISFVMKFQKVAPGLAQAVALVGVRQAASLGLTDEVSPVVFVAGACGKRYGKRI
ncbi:hypothetical protein [Ensifer adhaerens]|uniref:hypothetical protein n=1 Tax=Ensifer adhaerens TaxID=106592 RepID=UPI0015C2E3B7|nr:hypothetical protein [Ensifer adhaerens]